MSLSRRGLPPLNALRAFEVAGRRLSFRAAADELGVTQGAVAQQVRALEAHLGFALFQRLPRGLALTPLGASYLADVTRALDTLGEATARLLARPNAVTISVTPTFAAKLLIPRLADFNVALPGVELRIVATESLSDFDRDQVDIAVRLTRPPFPSTQEAHLLFRQNLVAVASPHLVGRMTLPLTPDELLDLPLLHDSHGHWSALLPMSGPLPGPVFNQTTLALDAALAGHGVAIAARAFVQADLDAGRLAQVSGKTLMTSSDYYLIRKRAQFAAAAVESVWGWCKTQLVS
ncbi:LysR substrate-binding domain-containing protein [Xinfangfangia sp. CPCC 101601]|uniref:LysR substrate-binding domain-containing protein n=1 Tax=Pseudogemmobacter lacusdianii TaxID=3069608 RepID=A0ABU0W2E6_9RHOB|nr:LysR substrate-binding domain-containing protein [Xinfangfangia sp. CPCC 101601]MDQ2068195.1 LysR substrate-binding domain-containing protein [Xinfangfangia sp. CPCC 101601]